MIKIRENNQDTLTIKQYPIQHWLAFAGLFIFSLLVLYHIAFQAPISSVLTCTKGLLNTNNCELDESALFNKNLTHKIIKNIRHPQKANRGRSNTVYLKTDYKQIKKIYYPTSWIIDPFLYRTNKQVAEEVNQLREFIEKWDKKQKIIISRKVPTAFFIVIWFMLLPTFLPIVLMFLDPIRIYFFDLNNNNLTVEEIGLFLHDQKLYELSQLKIHLLDHNKPVSILLETDEKKNYTFDNLFDNDEAAKLFKLLSRFTTAKSKNG